MNISDHDKIQLVHDALAECRNSNELYLLLHEHYQNARCQNPCSAGRDATLRTIGAIVYDAIRELERGMEQEPTPRDEAENAELCRADDAYHERLERGEA